MRRRFLTLVLSTLVLALLMPTIDPAATADVVSPTVIDEIDGLPAAPGAATGAAGAAVGGETHGDAPRLHGDGSDDHQLDAHGHDRSDPHTAMSGALETKPIRAPIAFSMLAFTAPRRATVWFRTSADGHDWTRWEAAAEPDGEGPDAGTAEARNAHDDHRRSGEAMWVGEGSWLQVRVVGAAPADIDVDLIDSLGLSRSLLGRVGDAVSAAWNGTTIGRAAHADGQPGLVTRAGWGANESLRSGMPYRLGSASYAIVHHTVNRNDYTRAQAPAVVRGIYSYHTQSRGWSDIGYNFLVDRFGTVYEGRAGGLTQAVVGAHALGFNTGSVGVALIGDHRSTSVSSAARTALTRLLAWQFAEHDIDPDGHVRVTSSCTGSCKYPRGTSVRLRTLISHRDVGFTTCAGYHAYRLLPDIREAMQDIRISVLSNPAAAPASVDLTPQGLSAPVRLTVDLRPGGAWKLTVRSGSGDVVHRDSGRGRTADSTWHGSSDADGGTYSYRFTSGTRTPETGSFRVVDLGYTPPFSDDDNSVHQVGITALYERGITKGCTSTRFCPARQVSRGQMASLLARTMDYLLVTRPKPTVDHFTDDNNSVHRDAIDSLAQADVVTPCGDGVFCPTADVVRSDVAVWLASAFDLEPADTDHFTDDDGSDAEWAINALADAGLTTGCTATTYCPDDATSRGQMATFLWRAITELEASGLAG